MPPKRTPRTGPPHPSRRTFLGAAAGAAGAAGLVPRAPGLLSPRPAAADIHFRLIDPFPGRYDASDPFGSYAGGRAYPHTGSDWGVARGTPIPAIGSGTVVRKAWSGGNGHTVTVALPDGHYYACLHMDVPAVVEVGDAVDLGQTLGYVGDTGTNSRGAHLHVTVSDSAEAYLGLGSKIDPWAFIQAHLDDTEPTPPPPSQEELDEMAATKSASIVRDYQAEAAGIVHTALIFPDGTAVALSKFDDIDNAVLAHVQVYGIAPTNPTLTTPRDRFGSQVNTPQWTAFWKAYPGRKVGSFA